MNRDTIDLIVKAGSAAMIGVFAIWTMGQIQLAGLDRVATSMGQLTNRMDLLNGAVLNIQDAIMDGNVCRDWSMDNGTFLFEPEAAS